MNNYDYNSFFPYDEYRPDQEDIIKEINKTIVNKRNFVLIAPNGTGKSVISLTSVLPIVFSNNLKLIYLCRTHQQNDRIIKELRLIKKKYPELNGIALKGRKALCANEDLRRTDISFEDLMTQCELLRKKTKLTGRGCPYYEKFVSKSEHNDLEDPEIIDLFNYYRKNVVKGQKITEICIQKTICPYYFIRKLLDPMRIIVCNYNWIFHSNIRAVFQQELKKTLNECILVVDECHNLPEAVLDINEIYIALSTSSQCSSMLNSMDEGFQEYPIFNQFKEFTNQVIKYLLKKQNKYKEKFQIKKNKYNEEKSKNPVKLLGHLLKESKIYDLPKLKHSLEEMQLYVQELYSEPENTIRKKFLINWIDIFSAFWINWIKCCLNDELNEKHYFGFRAEENKKKIKVRLYLRPLDSRDYIKEVLENIYASLHVSGTLFEEVYSSLTSLDDLPEPPIVKYMKSPFPEENIDIVIIRGLSSQYLLRTESMFKKINACIKDILESRKGNTGIFTVSYEFLSHLTSTKLEENSLKTILKSLKRPLFKEKRGNTSAENSMIIEDFKTSNTGEGAVLLGVLGGRNSEGEDFPGDEMKSVIIVGFPFPPPSPYIDKKVSYFNKIFHGQGKLYAQIEPTMRKANQAAGRPIRKMDEKVSIIFLDERYCLPENFQYLSKWLKKGDSISLIHFSKIREYLNT